MIKKFTKIYDDSVASAPLLRDPASPGIQEMISTQHLSLASLVKTRTVKNIHSYELAILRHGCLASGYR